MNYQYFNKKKNYINHSFLLLIFIFQFVLPILIFGHVGIMPHDSLEIGVPHDYIISKIYNRNTKFDKSDRRHRLPHFASNMWSRNENLLDILENLGKKYNKTISQIALRWVLDSGFVDSVIIGAKNCTQIEENYSTLEWSLSEEDFIKLSLIQ